MRLTSSKSLKAPVEYIVQAVLSGPSGHNILGQAGLTIGRIESNQLVVYDRRVSARHAVISSLKQGYYTITDVGSTNGTFVNGQSLTHNVPSILHDGETILIGDTVLTFQFSEEIRTFPDDFAHDDASNPTWESSVTDRVARVRNQEDVNYFPVASQEKQEPLELRYVAHSTTPQSATGSPSQKAGEIYGRKSSQEGLHPTTRRHRRKLLFTLLIVLMLLGVIVFSTYEFIHYLNRSTPGKTLDTFCSALHGKDCQTVYAQLSDKLQRLGSEKIIADDLSNVKSCIYTVSRESEGVAIARISFKGLSGQSVNGTIILIKDSNNTWKIDNLQNI